MAVATKMPKRAQNVQSFRGNILLDIKKNQYSFGKSADLHQTRASQL